MSRKTYNCEYAGADPARTQSTTHGDFDDDKATRKSVISLIKTGKLSKV